MDDGHIIIITCYTFLLSLNYIYLSWLVSTGLWNCIYVPRNIGSCISRVIHSTFYNDKIEMENNSNKDFIKVYIERRDVIRTWSSTVNYWQYLFYVVWMCLRLEINLIYLYLIVLFVTIVSINLNKLKTIKI